VTVAVAGRCERPEAAAATELVNRSDTMTRGSECERKVDRDR